MNFDLLTQATYLPITAGVINVSATANYGPLQMGGTQTTNGGNNGGFNTLGIGFKGRLALIINSSAGGGTTPALTCYLATGPTSNAANSTTTNLVLTNYNLGANALAANPLNSNIATFTTNGGLQVFGFDSRAVSNYVFLCTTIAGTNNPNFLLSAAVAALKSYEPS